jgi:hypothetical protein
VCRQRLRVEAPVRGQSGHTVGIDAVAEEQREMQARIAGDDLESFPEVLPDG